MISSGVITESSSSSVNTWPAVTGRAFARARPAAHDFGHAAKQSAEMAVRDTVQATASDHAAHTRRAAKLIAVREWQTTGRTRGT